MTDTLTDSDFRRYALLGAEARLVQIDKEAASIYQTFPELRKEGGAQDTQARTPSARAAAGRGRRRGGMSAAQREAVRERMKRYWAQRRSAGATSGEASGTDASSGDAVSASAGTRKGKAKQAKTAEGTRSPRKMSAAARKRISDAQKARWAKRRRANA